MTLDISGMPVCVSRDWLDTLLETHRGDSADFAVETYREVFVTFRIVLQFISEGEG